MKSEKIKKIIFPAVCVLLTLAAVICFIRIHTLSNSLTSQQAAERWQGESETEFKQLSAFFSEGDNFSINSVGAFRSALVSQLKSSSYDDSEIESLFNDCWSVETTAALSSERVASTSVSVIAVGGDYFFFHPIRLISGSYISDEDFASSRILIDEELAWLLFGGTDVAGQIVYIETEPYAIAGVIEREQDAASLSAYTGGRGIYMLYSALQTFSEDTMLTCYEVIMPEPVTGYALTFFNKTITAEDAEKVENTGRFATATLIKNITRLSSLAVKSGAVEYPYWENAAKLVLTSCTLLMLAGMLLAFIPFVTVVFLAVKYTVKGFHKLKNEVIPSAVKRVDDRIEAKKMKRWQESGKQY